MLTREWTCAVCGCSCERAEAKRRQRGLGPLHRNAKLCSPECLAEQRRRWARARRGTPPEPLPATWRCAGCGCSLAAATRWRRANGRYRLSPIAKTCGREACQREAKRRYDHGLWLLVRDRPVPKPPSGEWRCAVCGVPWQKAKRRSLGVRTVTCSRACSEEWLRMRLRARWRGGIRE